MSIEEITFEAEERMEKSVSLLGDQLRGIRTGRANTGLVESIRVEYYGSPTPLKQLANLSTPEAQQISDPALRHWSHWRHHQGDPDLGPRPDPELGQQGRSPERPPALCRTAQEAGWPRQGPRRGGPHLDSQHPTRRQQVGRRRDCRQGSHRGRSHPLQGRGPDPDQEVRRQGQRPRRAERVGDHGRVISAHEDLGLHSPPPS